MSVPKYFEKARMYIENANRALNAGCITVNYL